MTIQTAPHPPPVAMNDTFGSLSWARRTSGRVSSAELIAQAVTGLRVLLVERPKLWLYSRRLLGGGTQKLFDEVPCPRSDAACDALAEMERCSPPFLAGHCHRTYVLGWMLGRVRGLVCDAELLYVASLLHDLPLTERYLFRTEASECFALDGATIAGAFLKERGWNGARVHAVQNAICLHVNVQVPRACGVEAHLLNAGAGCDLTGIGLPSLHGDDLRRLVQKHPRTELAVGFAGAMEEQVKRRPASRARLLQSFGLRSIIARAPFPRAGRAS